jgi:hypothetical protein
MELNKFNLVDLLLILKFEVEQLDIEINQTHLDLYYLHLNILKL